MEVLKHFKLRIIQMYKYKIKSQFCQLKLRISSLKKFEAPDCLPFFWVLPTYSGLQCYFVRYSRLMFPYNPHTNAFKCPVCQCRSLPASTGFGKALAQLSHERQAALITSVSLTAREPLLWEIINKARRRISLLKHSPAFNTENELVAWRREESLRSLSPVSESKPRETLHYWSVSTMTCWLKDYWWKGKTPLKQPRASEVPHQTQVDHSPWAQNRDHEPRVLLALSL